MPLKGSYIALLANRLHLFPSRDGLRSKVFFFKMVAQLFATLTGADCLLCFPAFYQPGFTSRGQKQYPILYVLLPVQLQESALVVFRLKRLMSALLQAISLHRDTLLHAVCFSAILLC